MYIGSGTDTKSGISAHLSHHDRDIYVSHGVAKALENGYNVLHKGLSCLISITSTAIVPILRVLFTALEVTFTFIFWPLSCKTNYGYDMAHICL